MFKYTCTHTHTHTNLTVYPVKIFLNLFLYLRYLSALGLPCSMQDLVPQLGMEPRLPVLGARSLSFWSTSKVP